jgi:hypothetical protein
MVLHFQKGRRPPRPRAPVAEFNPFLPDACVAAQVLLSWPNDPRRQAEVLATGHVHQLGFATDDLPEALNHGFAKGIENLAQRLNVTTEALHALPDFQRVLREVRSIFSEGERAATTRSMENLTKPAGGFKTAAAAPGWTKIEAEAEAATNVHGRRAGLIMLTVARLALHHPNLTASAKRACFAVARTPATEGGVGPTEPATIFKPWPKWRGIGPMYAALIIELEDGGRKPDPDGFGEGVLRVLIDGERLRRVLCWSIWLRNFALSHKLPNTGKAFLPLEEAVEYRVGLAPEQPPIHKLMGRLLDEAGNYVPNE